MNTESKNDVTGVASHALFGRLLFVYTLNGVVKCFSADEIRPLESAMLDIGWNHTATIDPARWIEAMANGNTEPSDTMFAKHADILDQASRERDEAREQRDRLAEALKQCREDSVELLAERDWWQNETRLSYKLRYYETRDNIDRADAALQSLTLNETISNQ